MIPQDKADELIDKLLEQIYHLHQYPHCVEAATECALIAVDEIINNYDEKYRYCKSKIYWQEVKQEIEKLCNNK